MNLKQLVRVSTDYTRSINIERDIGEVARARPYVLTGRARQTLGRIVDAVRDKDRPRAWALVGPYGSGKSAFGLFLNNLLGDPASECSKTSHRMLRQADAVLCNRYQAVTRESKGFCSIVLTGSPEPLGRRLVLAMTDAATRFFGRRAGRPPKVLQELRAASELAAPPVTLVMGLLTVLQEAVRQHSGRGLVLIIDELGKFLEYEARHRGASDIFLLQALAEHSVRDEKGPFILVVLLHQSFELYAQKFGEELKNEWKKVGGRFESVPFVETAEQTIRVVKAAITLDLPTPIQKKVDLEVKKYTSLLSGLNALPAGLSVAEAQELFGGCFPLHPVSLLLLPALCQRVAQNERTLFSYLGSHEPHGFVESIARFELERANRLPWIRPKDIFDYFILNQPGLTADHGTHRRWMEVLTALERVGDVSAPHIGLIKTIGLLNILGAHGGLKASEGILALCWEDEPSKKVLREALEHLQRKSVITYRKFNGEYRIWQGSDFDLESVTATQKAQIGRIDLAEVLNEMGVVPPVVARRHAIATGTLRYFVPHFVSKGSLGKIYNRKTPTIFLCIAETSEETDAFRRRLCALGRSQSLGAIYQAGSSLREAVADVQALLRVQRQSQELANDPVAQRELKDRLIAATQLETQLINAILEEPEGFEWVIAGQSTKIVNKRDLQMRLSNVLDEVYAQAPFIKNELINRDQPSSNAIAGRKKLLLAMLENASTADLGIEKFPPEKAMYRGVLRATGLHRQLAGHWAFQPPPEKDVARMKPVWDEVFSLLSNEHGEPVSLASIYAALSREPYGVKEGVLPILILAIYQALNKDIALCQGGQFVPFLTQDVLEGLLKTPAAYTLQRVGLDKTHQVLFRAYAETIGSGADTQDSLVTMLQPLAKMMMSLPEYTKRTKRLSPQAIAVRDLFFAAKSPIQLVFSDLPAACGVRLEAGEVDRQIALFAERLKAALTEIRVAYHGLLSELVEMLKRAFSLGKGLQLHELRDALRGRCYGLQAFTIDQEGLKAFIGRVIDTFGDESQWLVSVATFLARKPPEKWTDDDVQAVEFRLGEFVSRLNDLRQLQLHYERGMKQGGLDFEAALLRIISTETGEAEALIMLDQRTRDFVATKANDIRTLLADFPSDQTKLATLLTVLTDLLRPASLQESTMTEVGDKAA